MKGLGDLMKKAQQMKASMDRLQEELATKEVEAGAGGGMITVRATGAQEIVSIDIDPSVIDPEEKEMLQDLVTAAVNEALKKSQKMASEEMSKLTGGMNIPGLF